MNNYTRAELIEDEKMDIDIMIDEARVKRDWYAPDSEKWNFWDIKIDSLLELKDAVAEKYSSEPVRNCDIRFNAALNGGVRVSITRNANGHLPSIQRGIDDGTLDKNGNILPYSSFKKEVSGGSWDDHEIHSYTVDGE